jgi:hypothetical protein
MARQGGGEHTPVGSRQALLLGNDGTHATRVLPSPHPHPACSLCVYVPAPHIRHFNAILSQEAERQQRRAHEAEGSDDDDCDVQH